MNNTFGSFIKAKRIYNYLSVRAFSELIGISATYLSKIENGLKPAPKECVLEKIADVFMLNEDEKEQFYDLAAKTKGDKALAKDLIEYINENEIIHKTLRTSKRLDINPGEWEKIYKQFIDK